MARTAERVEPGHFQKVVSGAMQIVEQKADGRQSVVQIGVIAVRTQRLPIKLAGLRVLCLAAGGGWHGPLFASLGAEVTVVDISGEMIEREGCRGGSL